MRFIKRQAQTGHAEARADLSGQQRLEPLLLLLRRAVQMQHLHIARVYPNNQLPSSNKEQEQEERKRKEEEKKEERKRICEAQS